MKLTEKNIRRAKYLNDQLKMLANNLLELEGEGLFLVARGTPINSNNLDRMTIPVKVEKGSPNFDDVRLAFIRENERDRAEYQDELDALEASDE